MLHACDGDKTTVFTLVSVSLVFFAIILQELFTYPLREVLFLCSQLKRSRTQIYHFVLHQTAEKVFRI